MNNKLKIVVMGGAGAGKTSMGILIEQTLINAGFSNVELIDIDVSDSMREDFGNKNLDMWKDHTDVVIETVQLSRSSSTAR